VSFLPHAFNQNEHPFGQCGHFSQVEHFEKPLFFVVIEKVENPLYLKIDGKFLSFNPLVIHLNHFLYCSNIGFLN
jgi:hypothetical protein